MIKIKGPSDINNYSYEWKQEVWHNGRNGINISEEPKVQRS